MMPKTYKSHNMDTGVKARWILLRVILILFSFFEDSRAGGIPSFCNIPPVKEGGDGTLTCTFTENISVTKRDFEVDRYSSTNYKQDALLVCTWIIDQPTCYLNPRITFDRVVTNTLKIKIPNVTSDDAGKYICYVLPTPNGISKSCNLMLEETTFIPATYEPRYPMPRSSDLPMIDTSTSIQDSKEDGIIPASVISIIIAVNITIFVLQGICCLLVIRYYKRRWTNDNDKNSNKKFINSEPIHGEEDENQLCGLLEKDTPIREHIPMSCNLTSTSEVEPTYSGSVQYKNKYANTRKRKLRSSIKRTSDELESFDSRIVLIKNKSTNTRERRLRSSIKRRTSDDLMSFDSRYVLSEDRHEHNTGRNIMSSLTMGTFDDALSIDSGILMSDDQLEQKRIMSSLTMSTSEDALSIDSEIPLSDDQLEQKRIMSSLTMSTSEDALSIDSEIPLSDEVQDTKTVEPAFLSNVAVGDVQDSVENDEPEMSYDDCLNIQTQTDNNVIQYEMSKNTDSDSYQKPMAIEGTLMADNKTKPTSSVLPVSKTFLPDVALAATRPGTDCHFVDNSYLYDTQSTTENNKSGQQNSEKGLPTHNGPNVSETGTPPIKDFNKQFNFADELKDELRRRIERSQEHKRQEGERRETKAQSGNNSCSLDGDHLVSVNRISLQKDNTPEFGAFERKKATNPPPPIHLKPTTIVSPSIRPVQFEPILAHPGLTHIRAEDQVNMTSSEMDTARNGQSSASISQLLSEADREAIKIATVQRRTFRDIPALPDETYENVTSAVALTLTERTHTFREPSSLPENYENITEIKESMNPKRHFRDLPPLPAGLYENWPGPGTADLTEDSNPQSAFRTPLHFLSKN